MKKKRSKNKPAGTMSTLAKSLGVSRQLIWRHSRKPGAPPFTDRAGWELWLAANAREGSDPPALREAIGKQRLELLKQMVARAKRENEKAQDRTLDKNTIGARLARGMALLFSRLDSAANIEWPPQLKNLPEQAIQQVLLKGITQIKAGFRDDLSQLLAGTEPDTDKPISGSGPAPGDGTNNTAETKGQ